MIQEKMKTSQSRQKSYHDKRKKDIEFQVGDQWRSGLSDCVTTAIVEPT